MKNRYNLLLRYINQEEELSQLFEIFTIKVALKKLGEKLKLELNYSSFMGAWGRSNAKKEEAKPEIKDAHQTKPKGKLGKLISDGDKEEKSNIKL